MNYNWWFQTYVCAFQGIQQLASQHYGEDDVGDRAAGVVTRAHPRRPRTLPIQRHQPRMRGGRGGGCRLGGAEWESESSRAFSTLT